MTEEKQYFKVVCDGTNNTQKDIDNGTINTDIYIDFHQMFRDELVKELENRHQDQLTYILIHPDAYKVIENYKNQTPLQRVLWNIKWGFKDCLDNFRNWQGHMRGEEWDFWEILNGEWSAYE